MLGGANKEQVSANIVNYRNNEFNLNNNEFNRINTQLNALENKETTKNRIYNIAANVEKSERSHDGEPMSINEKIKEVESKKQFPYNLPIIGDFFVWRKVNKLKTKRKKRELELLESTGAAEYLGKAELKYYRDEIQALEQENAKLTKKWEKILGPAINYLEKKGMIDTEQKNQLNNECKQMGINVQESNKTLTEEQWKMLEQAVEQHKKEVQDKSQSPNAEQKQEGQAKEEGATKKPDPKALENDKANQVQTGQTQATKEVMQQKNGVQQTQTAAKIKNIDTNVDVDVGNKKPANDKGTGMQIVAGEVKTGTAISSGATSHGTGQSQNIGIGGK